ncbi:GerAB/ArcD/ProY family transporter [Clostridium sp. 19966]|uniref:GerAB/ArcD/ProY family transporter n=1 Tax=Clostridium sp. 19966 TaxID=2768166 RepID=UPI0028DFA220|nr:GerAB/ArcD/ProY family transporter [Clostridium sp. 19966]MDT8718546.1 GerAB/ArcD/ProY family transporter [Clostridium sp. 19966]
MVGGEIILDTSTTISASKFTCSLISSMIGVGVLYLPNVTIRSCQQDAWITCVIAVAYPIYLTLICCYISKKNNENILQLSIKCFGPIFGNIANLIFISFFIFLMTSQLADFSDLFRVYSTNFLTKIQVFLASAMVIAYVCYKGIITITKLNEVLFYLTLVLIFVPLGTLVEGSIMNIKPILGTGVLNIIKGSKEALYFYIGAENIFLFYPFLEDKKKLLPCGIIGIIFVMLVCTGAVFLSIYYLGIDVAIKFLWPMVALSDAINIPIITSTRYIFISLWGLLALKCMVMSYFSACFSLNQVFKKVSTNNFSLILYPVAIILTSFYGNLTTSRYYFNKITVIYVLYNLIFTSAIFIIIRFKKTHN